LLKNPKLGTGLFKGNDPAHVPDKKSNVRGQGGKSMDHFQLLGSMEDARAMVQGAGPQMGHV